MEDVVQALENEGLLLVRDFDFALIGSVLSRLSSACTARAVKVTYNELRVVQRDEALPGSMSSLTGAGAQPMHTDGAFMPEPPRYLVFYCFNQGTAGRTTRVSVLDPFKTRTPLPAWLRDMSWIALPNARTGFHCPVIDSVGNVERVRYDPLCMKALRGCGGKMADVLPALEGSAIASTIEWEPRSLLVLDNWRCLHARSVAIRHDDEDNRLLGRWTVGGD